MWDKNLKIQSNYFFKGLKKSRDKKSFLLNHGGLGLFALESGLITAAEIRAISFFLKKNLKKNGKVWYNLLPNCTFTKKSIGTRMGKGKGGFNMYVFPIRRGRLLIEIESSSLELSERLLKQVQHKLGVRSKIVKFLI